MVKKRIHSIVKIDSQAVPLDENGYYLDWTKITGEYAEVLTTYGWRYFTLGGPAGSIVLDFAKLPNGYYFLTAACEPDNLDLHPEDRNAVCSPDEVVESAYHLVSHSIEALERHGVECTDPWDFLRKVCLDVEKNHSPVSKSTG